MAGVTSPETRWKRVIYENCPGAGQGRPYLTRYHLFRTRWLGVYLHHFHQSDNDRHLHDHPWSFIILLLSAGYLEYTDDPGRHESRWAPPVSQPHWVRYHPRWSLLCRPAGWRHRVEIPHPMWTLVVRGPLVRRWGFWTPRGWQHHTTYEAGGCE